MAVRSIRNDRMAAGKAKIVRAVKEEVIPNAGSKTKPASIAPHQAPKLAAR